MAVTYFPAIIDRTDSGFAVTFPDLPGCIAAGDTFRDAIAQSERALAFHVEALAKDRDPIPEPSDFRAVLDGAGDDYEGVVMIRVDLAPKTARVLISIDENLLRAVDAASDNRSAFFADAARQRLHGIVAAGILGQGELATMNRADLERDYGLKQRPSKPGTGRPALDAALSGG